jgi:uncharacterized membrane protein YfcA
VTIAIVAIVCGVFAGMLSGLFGVGGAIVLVPALIFLGLSPHDAIGTSLAAMVPMLAVGSWRQQRYGNIDWRPAILVGVASIATTKLGEVAAASLSNVALRRAFAVVVIVLVAQFALNGRRSQTTDQPGAAANGQP